MSDVFQMPAFGWKPRPDQVPIWRRMLSNDFRRGVIVAHRRYGKDELGLQMTAVKAMQRVGSYWYCLPEYTHARRAVWEMVNWRTRRTRIDDAFPPEIVVKRNDQTMMLWLESGSTVQLIGSDNIDSLVGGGQVGIVMSEAALSNPKAVQFFRPILEESGGFELQISTPRGKNHFYKSYCAAKEDEAAGDSTVMAAYMAATQTGVFNEIQLARIRNDLIRETNEKMGKALFAQEYLCDWNAAVVGAVWGDELSVLEADGRSGKFPFDRRFPVHTSWDLGVGDETVILFWQDIGGFHRLIDAHEATGLGIDTYIDLLVQKREQYRYVYGEHIAPHDVNHREKLRGISVQEGARRMGLDFKRMPNTRVTTQINCAAQLINNMQANTSNPAVAQALERFKGYKYNQNKLTGDVIPNPVHDINSHASSALMTYSIYKASRLGVAVGDVGTDVGSKFDPRQFNRAAPFSHDGSVSRMHRSSAFG